MINSFLLLFGLLFFAGCSGGEDSSDQIPSKEIVYIDREIIREVEVDKIPSTCLLQSYDSKFVGRIVYPDKSPYKRGSIKAEGDDWVSHAMTDDNGEFEIEVMGDSRFFFSAYSTYGDFKFYPYAVPLIVQQEDIGSAYECEYDVDVFTCYENNVVR